MRSALLSSAFCVHQKVPGAISAALQHSLALGAQLGQGRGKTRGKVVDIFLVQHPFFPLCTFKGF